MLMWTGVTLEIVERVDLILVMNCRYMRQSCVRIAFEPSDKVKKYSDRDASASNRPRYQSEIVRFSRARMCEIMERV